MAADLRVELSADIKKLVKALDNAEKALKNTGEVAERSAKKVGSTGATAAKGVNKLGKSTANATPTLQEFSRVIQDAPFGIQGVGNNITQLVSSFGNLSRSTGGATGAFKLLLGSLIGPAGILFAVSSVVSLLTVYGDELFKSTNLTKQLAEAGKDLVGSARAEVNALRQLVDIASDETLSRNLRNRAVQKINEQYGEYLGNLDLELIKTRNVTAQIDALTNSLLNQAKARAAQQLIEEKFKDSAEDLLTLQLKRSEAAKAVKKEVDRLRSSVAAFNNVSKELPLTQQIKEIERIINQSGGSGSGQVRVLANLIAEFNQAKIEVDDFEAEFQSSIAGLQKIANQFTVQSLLSELAKLEDVVVTGNKLRSVNAKQTTNPLDAIFAVDQSKLTSRAKLLSDFATNSIQSVADATNKASNQVLESLSQFDENFDRFIENSLVNTLSGFGQAIGNALVSGGNVIEAAGGALLGAMGNIAIQLGEMVVAQGLAIEAAKKSLLTLSGIPAIAIGTGLIALGSIFKKGASNLAGGFGGGGGASISGQGGGSFTGSAASFSSSSGGGTVVFEIAGTKLVGVLNRTLKKNRQSVADVI